MSQVKNETIEKMKAQREKLNLRIQSLENKRISEERKKDVRRKILAGAYVIDVLCKGDVIAAGEQLAQAGLLDERDRALFGLDGKSTEVGDKPSEDAADKFAGV